MTNGIHPHRAIVFGLALALLHLYGGDARGDIVIVGASNSAEVSGFPPLEQYEPFWVDIVDDRLQEPIVRLAVPGSTTWHWARWLVFFEGAYRQLIPEGSLVFLELGTNDHHLDAGPERGPLSRAEYEVYLTFILDRLLAYGAAEVALATPPPLAEWAYPDQTLLYEYAVVVAELCNAFSDVLCGPDLLRTLSDEAHINPDGVHYSRAGNRLVAELWLSFLTSDDMTAYDMGGVP